MMTLTIELPEAAGTRLNEESERIGIAVPELAARLLLERLKSTEPSAQRAPRPGFAADLFKDIDIDELLDTPIPGLEEYMPG